MFKLWLRYRAIISILLITVLGFISSFFFIKPNFNTYGENLLNTSVYENMEADYNIPSPNKKQIQDLKELDFVDDILGYYFTKQKIKINDKTIETKIIMSDCLDSLEISMFNKKRLIKETKETFTNPIYIDFYFYKNNDVKLGDKLYFNNIEFQVSRIYETNTYYKSAIFMPLVGEQKTYIESLTNSYSGAYVKTNDLKKADNYWKTYKPLGRLKDRSEFESDEIYQQHYDNWLNASYYNEITSFDNLLAEASVKDVPNYIIGFVVSIIILLVCNITLSFMKHEKIYFQGMNMKKKVIKYYIFNTLFNYILMIGVFILSIFIIKNGLDIYVPQSYQIKCLIIGCGFSLIGLIINLIYDIIFYKKAILK